MQRVLPDFDFTEALALLCADRITTCLNVARSLLAKNGYQGFSEFPCIPSNGATEEEIADFELELGLSLPAEYRDFLRKTRYLKIDDGREIGGFDADGVFITQRPWVSETHKQGSRYLVFANYRTYADGDQLMFDLSSPAMPVVVYFHEHAGLIEPYADSFSLAFWRLVHELL